MDSVRRMALVINGVQFRWEGFSGGSRCQIIDSLVHSSIHSLFQTWSKEENSLRGPRLEGWEGPRLEGWEGRGQGTEARVQ